MLLLKLKKLWTQKLAHRYVTNQNAITLSFTFVFLYFCTTKKLNSEELRGCNAHQIFFL